MHVPNRRWLASLILLLPAACASPEAEHKSEPPSQPSAAPEAAQGDQAWLDKVKQDTAHIAAGEPAAKAQDAGQAKAAPAPQDVQAVMQQSREHLKLVEQRTATLVKSFLDSGLAAMKDGNLQQAHEDFASAYELDPDDPAARQLYQSTSAQLGLPGGELGAVVQSAHDRAAASADQARLLIRQNIDDGTRALDAGDADAAVRNFEDAMLLLKSYPDAAEAGLAEADVAAHLAVARRAAQDAAEQRHAELIHEATAQQEQLDQSEAGRVERQIAALMEGANTAFLADEYETAEKALDQVLRLDPENQRAIKLKQVYSRAKHGALDRATRAQYRNEWQNTFDELTQDAVVPIDVMTFPDENKWKEINDRGHKSFGAGSSTPTSALDEAVRQKLEKAIPVDFQEEPLDAIVSHLQAVTGANFIISQKARDANVPPITLQDRSSQPVSRILKIVLEDLSLPPLTYTIEDGVVHIVTKDESRKDYVLEMYDIRDLTFTPKDYAAQDYNLLPSGSDKQSYQAPADEEPLPHIGADALLTLIQDNIAQDTWSSDPNRTIQLMPGTLVVRQTPDVHEQIRALLDNLRLNTKSLVHIETRFVEVEDSFLEDIGVDLRGLDGAQSGGFPLEDFGQAGAGGFGTPDHPTGIGTGNEPGIFNSGSKGDMKGRIENLFDFTLGEPNTLDGNGGLSMQALFLSDTNVQAVLRAVSKYETSNVVNAPSLTLRSGQRGNVKQLTTRTYVRDFEPEIAQAAVIAQPELDNVKEGVILDVRAVASADRRFVTLELRPTIIDLVPDASGNPLPQQTVSLATQNSSDVTIELPELRIQRLRTTATIPDGATLMLGGLKKSVEQDQKSGVPFLSDIPVLGSLFSRKGEYTSKRKLIILLKASILNPEENEPLLGAAR
jgi:type II secretory pathway component GspD/PulD (secretin)